MGESISEFMERRARGLARFGRKAEAAAHEAFGKAIRTGQILDLGSPAKVMAYGAELVGKRKMQAAGGPRPTANRRASSGRKSSPGVTGGLRDAALQADAAARGAANVLTFGGADHLAAGMNAMGGSGGLSGWKHRYATNLAQEKARNRYDKTHRPMAQTTGQVGGALLGVGLIGPMEGALAAAPRLSSAAALSGRESAAILAAGGGAGFGMQTLIDGVTGRRSTVGDNLGAVVGGVAGAVALPLGPARAGAVGAAATTAAQDLFNGRPVAVDRAGESAIAGNLLGGVAGIAGRRWADDLPRNAKGPLGEALGDIRSTINGLRRSGGSKIRDQINDGQLKPYWYPDGRSGSVRFEDKFGRKAKLTRNQALAQQVGGSNFRLYHFLPSDIGKAVSIPVAAAAPHSVGAGPTR